ncbi:hypothetical protein [Polluticoccus soli]|uniref:hypothetical protein n=1 Tax=Polluticoccus soli TaxID=3034150 RepID=UPI0023E103F6|nr:hypothetical protein [Flavipsychrobacter sp. JY13-12]
MKLFLITCACVLLGTYAHAQNDTLSATEKQELKEALSKTPLGANFQAGSYSTRGDSAKAGEYLVKSDPYYMMFLGQTPESLPEFLSRFKSSKAAKDTFIEAFTRAYNAPKNAQYQLFKSMYKEDRIVRSKLDSCSTGELCQQLSNQMNQTDSVHSATLYNYVSKNGWPTMQNGGLYAGLLAVHDHKNHKFYIPHLKKAIAQGQSTLDALEILYYYSSHSQDHKAWQKFLDTSKKQSFDVSSLLRFELPANLSQIKKFAADHCPVEYHLVFHSLTTKIAEDWYDEARAHGNRDPNGHINSQFFNEVRKGCSRLPPDVLKGVWEFRYLPSDSKRSRMVLYVVYK